MVDRIKQEPALFGALIVAAVSLAAIWLPINAAAQSAIVGFVLAASGFFVRANVTPTAPSP